MPEKNSIDDFRMPPLAQLDPAERCDRIDALLTRAEADGVIAPLPESKDAVRSKELFESRIRTIRTRLYLLGYLPQNNESPVIDDRLKRAIRDFQAEARLEPDSWVGPVTWRALQELVSFEHDSNLESWFAKEPLNPALLRAIGLRMYVLGLCGAQERKEAKFDKALKKFALIARILNLSEQPLAPIIAYETINVLFDQDHLAGHLGSLGQDFMRFRPDGMSKLTAKRKIRKFVVNCAKVELWLLGYDGIRLDGKYKYRTPSARELITYLPADYPLFHALFLFWREQGFSINKARNKAFDIDGLFFSRLLQMQKEGEAVAEPNQSDKLYKVLLDEKPAFQEQVWDQIKHVGSRIWDGLKRVWRWFKAMLHRVAERLFQWAKNMARLAYQYALNAFVILKRLVKATRKAISFLMHRTFPGSNVHQIEIARDRDFDYRIYVNPGGQRAVISKCLSDFYIEASYFSIGMRLIGMLGNILISTVKNVARAAGWFGLILSLVKIYSNIKQIVQILNDEKVLAAEV